MRKIFAVIGIIFLCSLMLVPLVSASYVCPAAYTDTSGVTYLGITVDHPSSTSGASQQGVAFTANATCYLWNVTFWMYRAGVSGDLYVARLYEAAGTVGTNAYPTGAALSSSYTLNADDILGTIYPITLEFAGDYQMTNGQSYVIVLECTDDSGTGVSMAKKEGSASFNSIRYYSSSYHFYTYDFLFQVNGDTAAYGGATPTPTPTVAPSGDGDATLEYWGGVISDWIFPMLLVLVPAFLGLKFLGQTGFIIGLNIGVIIGYAAIPLVIGLWAVILVGLMDVVFIYMTRS